MADKTDFPKRKNQSYLLSGVRPDGTEQPFYNGETERFPSRMDDYRQGAFKAPTDFKVGEAIRRLEEKGMKVKVECQEHPDRKSALQAQARMTKELRDKGVPMLNDLPGYDYRTADEETERRKIHEFCDKKIISPTKRRSRSSALNLSHSRRAARRQLSWQARQPVTPNSASRSKNAELPAVQ
jgi:hypothetical protein